MEILKTEEVFGNLPDEKGRFKSLKFYALPEAEWRGK